MPLVTVKVIEGVFTQAQKQEMINKITDTMVEIEGENLRPVTWVLVEEVRSGDWGIAGHGLTTADVRALQAQPLGHSGLSPASGDPAGTAARASAHRRRDQAAVPAAARAEVLGATGPDYPGRTAADQERACGGAVRRGR